MLTPNFFEPILGFQRRRNTSASGLLSNSTEYSSKNNKWRETQQSKLRPETSPRALFSWLQEAYYEPIVRFFGKRMLEVHGLDLTIVLINYWQISEGKAVTAIQGIRDASSEFAKRTLHGRGIEYQFESDRPGIPSPSSHRRYRCLAQVNKALIKAMLGVPNGGASILVRWQP